MSEEKLEQMVEDETKEEENENVEVVDENPNAALPFKRAEIYRLLRNNMPSDKIIRASVKEEMNVFLGRVGKKVAEKLGESKYSTIELMDFVKITRPYDEIETINEERQRMTAALERIKMDCDSMIRDVNRYFTIEADDLGPSKKKVIIGSDAPSEDAEESKE
ncbi:MAG: hypothetical protein GOV15_01845 [Candidatus Diapherotrites archaeon]|nr:hypothetical protein [Candidatus Diapherotrites archaeon]